MRSVFSALGAALLALAIACSRQPLEPARIQDCQTRFRLRLVEQAGASAGGAAAIRRVAVAGDWNGFSPTADLLADPDGDGTYTGSLTLAPGGHGYLFVVDDEERHDPENPLTRLDGEREVSEVEVPDCRQPALVAEDLRASGQGVLSVRVRFVRSADSAALDPRSLRVALEGEPLLTVRAIADGFERIHVAADGLAAGKHRLSLTASDLTGRATPRLLLPFWVEAEPFLWEDALIYQIVVDRFRRSPGNTPSPTAPTPRTAPAASAACAAPAAPAASPESVLPIADFHGGDLAGVLASLEEGYFDHLGVSALWLSPLYDNPEEPHPGRYGYLTTAYHGYWPAAPRTVEPRFGGEAALDALVAAAHRRGLRVLMDLVPNHIHVSHPYYLQHQDDDWFNGDGTCVCGYSGCAWGEHIQDCWFEPFLPDFRFRPAVVSQLVADTTFWRDRFDLDGFRIDAVPMMPRLVTRHLAAACHATDEVTGVRTYLVGETYTGAAGWDDIRWYLGPHGLDGQFDFPLMWTVRGAFAEGSQPLSYLEEAQRRSERLYDGSGAVMALFIGNHDLPRFVTVAAGNLRGDPSVQGYTAPPPAPDSDTPYRLLLLAHTFVLTQAGAPVIYYGDEVGLAGAGDPDSRRPMRFAAELSAREQWTIERVARLGRLRRCLPALRRGGRHLLHAATDSYAYVRDSGDGMPAIVVLNRGQQPLVPTLPLPDDVAAADGELFDAVDGLRARLADHVLGSAVIPPQSGAVFIPAQSRCATSERIP